MLIYADGKSCEIDAEETEEFKDSMNSLDGVFETVRVKKGKPEYLEHHLKRLKRGAEFLNADFPELNYKAVIKKLVAENMLNGSVSRMRIIVYIGDDDKSHFCLMLEPYHPPRKAGYSAGVQLITAMHPCCESALARIKCTRRDDYSRLRDMSADKGFFDCMLTDRRGVVTETTICSLFFVEDGRFYTPPCDCSRLKGIMETVVIEELDKMGVKVKEKEYRSKDITAETAMFMTNSLIGVMPVKSINRTFLNNVAKEPGVAPLIKKFSPHK